MIRKKTLKEMNLLDKFLFDEAVEDTEFLEILLSIILGKDVLLKGLPHVEKELRGKVLRRQVRLDVWAEDVCETVYNTEVQQNNTGNLPRRSRLYQAMITSNLLPPGSIDFNLLNDVFVIIIAPFDLFEKGRYVYTFRMACEEIPELKLGDGATSIFLNTRGTDPTGASEELIDLLHYIEKTTEEVAMRSPSDRIHFLQEKVLQIRTDEQREIKLMNSWEEKIMERQNALEEGFAQGLEQGRSDYIREMIQKLRDKGHSDAAIAELMDLTIEEVRAFGASSC